MRFMLRIVGTWLLGMTMILLVMDGTKSLAQSSVVTTGLGDIWTLINANSLLEIELVFDQNTNLAMVWAYAIVPVLSWPGWAVLGLPGLFMIVSGQTRNRRR